MRTLRSLTVPFLVLATSAPVLAEGNGPWPHSDCTAGLNQDTYARQWFESGHRENLLENVEPGAANERYIAYDEYITAFWVELDKQLTANDPQSVDAFTQSLQSAYQASTRQFKDDLAAHGASVSLSVSNYSLQQILPDAEVYSHYVGHSDLYQNEMELYDGNLSGEQYGYLRAMLADGSGISFALKIEREGNDPLYINVMTDLGKNMQATPEDAIRPLMPAQPQRAEPAFDIQITKLTCP